MKFNTHAVFDQELTTDQDLDKPIWQINQAAQGVWFGTQNTPDWRLYLNVIVHYWLFGLDSLFSCIRWNGPTSI